MPQPINYQLDVSSPVDQALQGFGAGAQIAQMMDARAEQLRQRQLAEQQRQAALQRQQQMQQDLGAMFQDGRDPSARDYAQLSIKYPELSKQFKQSWDMLAPEQRDQRIAQASQVYSAAHADPKIAKQLLLDQGRALRDAGNTHEAEAREALAQVVEIHPEVVRPQLALSLAAALGPDKFVENFSGLQTEQRKTEDEPERQRAVTAETIIKEADQHIREARAMFTPAKLAADIGLTTAQTGQSRASAAASYGSAALSRARAADLARKGSEDVAGHVRPNQRAAAEQRMREEYNRQVKNYRTIQDGYQQIQSIGTPKPGEEGPADLGLVNAYMHMIDPTSAVIGNERAAAESAQGIPTRIRQTILHVFDGGRLDGPQRQSILANARKLAGAAGTAERRVTTNLRRIAINRGLNPDNVHYTETPVEPTGQTAPTAAPPAQRNIVVDY